jgi:hypothetical protein
MKYVMTFLCKNFFIDNYIVPSEHVSPFLKIHEIVIQPKKENKKIDISTGPFAKFKQYHKENKNEKKEIIKSQEKKDENQKEKQGENINYIKNKFILLGKIHNFSPLKRKTEKKNNAIMSYSQFKGLFQ